MQSKVASANYIIQPNIKGAAGRGGCDTQWTTWELFQHDDAVADDDGGGDDDDGDADARRY